MTHHQSPPATHNHGSNPIDGIFLPITLVDQCRTGYLEFGEAVPSDHQALWLDIPPVHVPSGKGLNQMTTCLMSSLQGSKGGDKIL